MKKYYVVGQHGAGTELDPIKSRYVGKKLFLSKAPEDAVPCDTFEKAMRLARTATIRCRDTIWRFRVVDEAELRNMNA